LPLDVCDPINPDNFAETGDMDLWYSGLRLLCKKWLDYPEIQAYLYDERVVYLNNARKHLIQKFRW